MQGRRSLVGIMRSRRIPTPVASKWPPDSHHPTTHSFIMGMPPSLPGPAGRAWHLTKLILWVMCWSFITKSRSVRYKYFLTALYLSYGPMDRMGERLNTEYCLIISWLGKISFSNSLLHFCLRKGRHWLRYAPLCPGLQPAPPQSNPGGLGRRYWSVCEWYWSVWNPKKQCFTIHVYVDMCQPEMYFELQTDHISLIDYQSFIWSGVPNKAFPQSTNSSASYYKIVTIILCLQQRLSYFGKKKTSPL